MPEQHHILHLLRSLRPQTASIPKTRVGAPCDGGYVLNDDLAGLDGVISLGIGGEVSFDLTLAYRGIAVYQYDPTVDGPPVGHSNFIFHKLGWAKKDGETMRSLATILTENGLETSGDLLLKFDVEDAEWDALDGVDPDLLNQFRIIVGELHWLDRLREEPFFETASRALALLTRNHVVTHLHANNTQGVVMVEGIPVPQVIEITLLRRDRATFERSNEPIPSLLDRPNNQGSPDIVLTAFG